MAALESELSDVKAIYLCIYTDKLQQNKRRISAATVKFVMSLDITNNK